MGKYPQNIGKILRALRKYYGIQQKVFCDSLGVNQSTLSRIETGVLEISALQWLDLIDLYKLDSRCLISGKIEQLENINFNFNKNSKKNHDIRIDQKYLDLCGMKVRSVYPFLQLMEQNIGVEKTNEFIKSKGIDPDFFVIQNLPINILFLNELFDELLRLDLLSINNYKDVLRNQSITNVHSYFMQDLKETTKFDVALKKLIKYVGNHYEINTDYEILGSTDEIVRASSADHLKEFNLTDEFLKFRPLYNLEHFNKLKTVLEFKDDFNIEDNNNTDWLISAA